jgi:hypothetical protein
MGILTVLLGAAIAAPIIALAVLIAAKGRRRTPPEYHYRGTAR